MDQSVSPRSTRCVLAGSASAVPARDGVSAYEWAPDGKTIAFVRNRKELRLLTLADSQEKLLATAPASGSGVWMLTTSCSPSSRQTAWGKAGIQPGATTALQTLGASSVVSGNQAIPTLLLGRDRARLAALGHERDAQVGDLVGHRAQRSSSVAVPLQRAVQPAQQEQPRELQVALRVHRAGGGGHSAAQERSEEGARTALRHRGQRRGAGRGVDPDPPAGRAEDDLRGDH